MQTQIRPWGNSQGIRLTKEILSAAGFHIDEELELSVSQGQILLQKRFRHRSLKERAAEYGGRLNLTDEIELGSGVEGELW